MRAVERKTVPDGDEHILQAVPLSPAIVHVTSGYHREAGAIGYAGQVLGQLVIAANRVALQLHEEPLSAEHRAAALGKAPGRGDPFAFQNPRQHSVPASGQDKDSFGPPLQRRKIEPRIAPVVAGQMRFGNEPAKVGVPLLGFGQQGQMRAIEQGQFGAGDGLDPGLPCGLGKRHRAIQAVMIGQANSRVAQLFGLEHQPLGEGSAVEKRECRVAVKLDVHRRAGGLAGSLYGRGREDSNPF